MADKNQAIYDWNLPKQDVAAADVAVKSGYQPSQEFDVESGAGGRFIEAQKKAIEDSKIQSQIQAKRISDYEADKKAKIDAVTHQFAQPLVKGIPIVSKQYSDIVNNVRKEAEHNYNLYEKSQQEQQDKQIESLPNHFFGFGKDKELYDKVHSFRADVAKGAEESLGTMPDWMKTNAVLKMFAPESAGVLEGAKQVAYNVFNTAEELLYKPTMKYKRHFQEEAKKMYPQASPETINNEAKKFYENWIIDKAKKERPGDFKEEGLTHYIDNTGNPTTELKKDAYRVANGDTKRLADATKQLIDYERGNFNAAKSRNQENWEQLEQMLVEKGSGIPYILQKTVGGALGAVNAEIETAKGLSSVLEGGSYSEGVANQKKNNASSIPTEMAVDLKGHPYVEAASSLGYGITNLLTRAYLAKSTFGEGETKPMQNFVNSLAKDAPNYGKASQFVYNALKNTPVSKFANITDKALDMSKIFFVPTLNDNIAKNRELGYSDKENYIKSTKDAIASMYIFSLIAHEPESAQKQFERLLNPEQRALFTNIKNTGKSMAVSGSAMAANKVYQDYADSKGDFDLGKSISGASKEFVQGAMFDLGMKALNPQQLLSKSPQSDAIAYFLRDKDALRQQLDSKLASGQITPQQYIDIPKAFNNLKSHFQEGKGFELDDRAAAQYATEKAKYGLLNNIVSQLKATPNSDPKKIAEAERRMNESARDIAQIRNGTYLKGRVISSKEMLDVAAKTKPENEKKAYTKDKKKLVIVSAPYVQEKMALEPLKTDDNVRKNLAILTHKEALQHNIDLHNKTQEEIDLIENGHKEIKGVRKALPMSEKDVKRLDALKEVRSNINKSLEPLGGTDAVKDMLEYDDKANNGHIVIDKNGKVIDGTKQSATKLFNGEKEGNIVRSLTDAERTTLAKQPVADPIAEDLKEDKDAPEPSLKETAQAGSGGVGDVKNIEDRPVWNNTGTKFNDVSNEGGDFIGKDGKKYKVSINEDGIEVYDENGKKAGWAVLAKYDNGDNKIIGVSSKVKRAGIATAMYDFVDSQIGKVRQSAHPTDEGSAFWDANKPKKQSLKETPKEGSGGVVDVEAKNKELKNIELGLTDRQHILLASEGEPIATVGDVSKIGVGNATKIELTKEEQKEVDKYFKAYTKNLIDAADFNKWRKDFSDRVLSRRKAELEQSLKETPKEGSGDVGGDVDLKGDKKQDWMNELVVSKNKRKADIQNDIDSFKKYESVNKLVKSFDNADDLKGFCDTLSQRFADKLVEEGVDAKDIQLIEGVGLKNGLDVNSAKALSDTEPKYISHVVVKIGDNVIDLSGKQFGDKYSENVIPYSEFKKNWNKVKDWGWEHNQVKKIKFALELDKYQKAISEGRMTATDAKKIIESAGLEVPKDIAEQALKETPKEGSGGVVGDVKSGDTFLFPNGEENLIIDIKGDKVYSVPADKPNYHTMNIDSLSDIKELMSKKEEYAKQANERNEREKNKELEEQKQKNYLDDIDDFGNDKTEMQKGKIKSILNNKHYGTKTTKDAIRDIMNKDPFIETLNGKEYISYKEDGNVYSLPEKYNNKTSREYLQHLIDIGYKKEKTPNEPIKDNKVARVLEANIRQNQTFAIVKIDGVEREVEIIGIDEKTGGFKFFDNENRSKGVIKRDDIVDYDIEPKEEYNKDAIETIPKDQPSLKETPKEGGKHQGVGTSVDAGSEVPTTDEGEPQTEVPKETVEPTPEPVADSVTPKEGLEPNGDTRINKDAIKEKYDQIFEHEQVSAQQEANDARESLVNSAEAKGISAEQEAENHVRDLASQEYGTHYAVSSYDIITTAFHKANLERDLARAKQDGEEYAAILIERQIEAVNDLILQKLGRASGKHLNLFSSVFNLAKDGTLKATQELLSKALGVDVPMTMEDLLKKHPKGDRDTEYKRLKPYVETIEAQKKAIEDKLKGDAEINEKYDKKDIEDYIKREVEKRIAEAKGKKTTKASKSLRSLAERIRKSDTLEKLGLGEPVLTDIHKAGTSFNAKEALAKVIDLIADGIDKAKAISDVLKEHGIASSKQFSTLVEQVIAKASSVNRDEVLDKIKEVSQAGALQNSISKPMVESGLVKDLVDYHIQEGLKADEVIKNTLADIKEVLTDVTEAQLVDAILQRGDFKIESRRAAISNEGARRREVKTIATKMAKLKAFEAADEIHAIELDETLTKEQKKAAIEAKKSEFEKELDKQIAEHEAAIKAAKEKNTNDAKIEANVNKLQSELDRLKERRGKEEVAKGAPIEKSQREKDLIDEIVKEKAKWSSEKREQKRYEANVAELERLTNRAKKEKAQSKDKTPIEKSEREKELDAKIKEQEDKWDAEITAAQEARKANNKLWAETQRQLKQVNDLKEKIAKAEELFKKANPKSNATPDTPEIEGYKKQLRDTRKQTLEKEREIRKIASEMTQEAKIREKIDHIKKTKTLFEEAIKDRKKTRPELQKLREELNNAMTDAGIRAQVSDKTDIKIAKEYEAKIEDVRNSDLSDDEKVAKIQDLEKQRDAEIGKTKQGVLANLKSNLDGSIDDLTSKLASEKDPVKAEEIKKVLEKIKELSKFTKATTQNAQDKINKAYAELDKLIKDNKGNEYEQMFKDLQDEFRGDFGKALNEIQQKRLYDTSVRRLREAQRILNSGLVTEIPSSKYDKERDNALLMHKAKYKPVWQKVQRMKQRAIEQNKGFMDKALDVRTRYLIMGLHPIETVLTAGVTKPFFDTLMKQTAGRLAGMITGIGHVSHKDIGKTFGAITKGILDKKGTPLEQKAINKYISKMNQQYIDALKAYDAIPDKTSKEALAAEKKLLRAEIAKEATLPYFFINANSAVDIKQIMVHAATDFDERMGEYNQSYKKDRTKLENLGYWIDAVNRTHGAIKSVSARQAMFYDYIESLQHLQKVKGEITPADAQLAWFLAADKGYKQGKFSERTMLSDLVTRGKTHDNAWVRGVSKFIFPVAKIAINIAKLHVDIGLPAEAIYKLAEATKAGKKLNVEAGDAARLQDNFRKGIDSLNLEQKKYLNTLLTRGLYGIAMWIIGVWLNHEDKLKYGGAFSPTDPFHKRLGQVLGSDGNPLKAGEWEINGWRLPEPLNIVMNHSGYFLPISLSTVWSQQVNREGATDAKTEAIHKNDVKNLMLATTNELTGKLPLQGAIQTIGMLYGEGLEYGLASMLPNTRGINKFVDKDENGEPVKRDTDSPTFLGKIYNIWKANNVGLSKTLPTKAEAALDKQANKVKEDIAFDNAPESVQDLKTVKQTEDAIKDAKFEIEKIKAALKNPEHPYVDDSGVPYTKEELESMKLDAEDDIKAYEDDIITISKQK